MGTLAMILAPPPFTGLTRLNNATLSEKSEKPAPCDVSGLIRLLNPSIVRMVKFKVKSTESPATK